MWGEVWRVLVAAVFGMVMGAFVAYEADMGDRLISDELWALDFLVGLLGLGLLPLRRRAPLTVALLLSAATTVSIAVVGAAVIAVVSLATHRRWWSVGVVGVVFVLAGWVYGLLHPLVGDPGYWPLLDVVGGVVIYALLVWIGAYIGLRREHLASLRERAETAEREQASRVAQARANERARIAREMHDVLAHRMSLVAMHAGALAYRTDLPPDKVAETASIVQSNAHAALTELREVLGVLRETGGPVPDAPEGIVRAPERPQPTLADLRELVDDARASGTEVHVDVRARRLDELPDAVSRHAFRIVQEAMTNARKHAPWAPVTVVVDGEPGEGLSLAVRNPVRSVGPQLAPVGAPPPSGLGLVGLTERAELVGGRLAYGSAGGAFVVSAWLPWAP
ncbi:signal transduction histidine kinase [Isoptericola variabilis J7]|nr:signal transduction histidine kinase [Isoptericola variabilis J7]